MLKPHQIRGRLIADGIIFRREAEKLGIAESTFNDILNFRCISKRGQEHIAGLLKETPQKVFGHFYRPEKARPRKAA